MKGAQIYRDVGANLAVALAGNEIACALAHTRIKLLLGDRQNRVVRDSGGGFGDFVLRWFPRCLEALLGQLALRPSNGLRCAILRR